MSRFVRAATTTLTLSNGDHLTIKRQLNAGEQRAAYAQIYKTTADGRLRPDPLDSGKALIEAYLIDWDLCDDDGVPVVIRPHKHQPPDPLLVRAALDDLSYPDFVELKEAIEAHEQRVLAEREEKKSDPVGATVS